ncbi:hypothetical protein PQX77_014578 [Marasmius sp. AFHP31]|nr:hypothetical protein PQX77_014578 [Marasmius sp. AFHP31]
MATCGTTICMTGPGLISQQPRWIALGRSTATWWHKEDFALPLKFIVKFEDFVMTKMLLRNGYSLNNLAASGVLRRIFDDRDLVYTLSYAKSGTSRAFGAVGVNGDDPTSYDGVTKVGIPEDAELGNVLDSTGARSDQIIRYYTSLFV